MNKVSILFILFLVVISIACKKEEELTLFGKWILKKHFVDIGNGQGNWQDPWDQYINMQFNADGSFVSDVTNYSHFNSYAVAGDTITFFRLNYPPSKIGYEFSGSNLIIKPNCPERCDALFERVQ